MNDDNNIINIQYIINNNTRNIVMKLINKPVILL